MLNQFRFLGYEVKKLSFENFDIESEGGFLNIESDLHKSYGFHIDDDGDCLFELAVDVAVSGKDRDQSTVVFECSEELHLKFICLKGKEDNSEEAVSDCLRKNSWFFQGFIDISVKSSLEKVLSETAFDNLNIPPCSTLEMEDE